MPELPEVETTCRDILASPIMGQPIVAIKVQWHRSIGNVDAKVFVDRLQKRKFTTIVRRGKYLHVKIDDGQSLLVHLRMSGSLHVRPTGTEADSHDRVIIVFESHELAFHDPRKFGRMVLTDTPEEILAKLGPEPFSTELSDGGFHRILLKKRGNIKSVLLDQHTIAGIGNIYADESLFLSRIHPMRAAYTLSSEESGLLIESIRESLSKGIESRGTSLGTGEGNFSSGGHAGGNGENLLVFHRTGKPCPICDTPIERIVVAQRSTHVCPHCQPLEVPRI